MADVVTLETEAWQGLARDAGIAYDGTAIVRGPGAQRVGEALLRLGSDRVIVDESRLRDASMVTPIDDIVDTVVLLHAWQQPSDVDEAAATAVAWVRPGGAVVLAELAADRLRSALPTKYPSALLYQAHPDLGAAIERRCVTTIQLAGAGIRAGIDGKTLVSLDRPVGLFASPQEHRIGIESGAWRGVESLDDAARDAVIDGLNRLPVVTWPLAEQEPWVALAGLSRR